MQYRKSKIKPPKKKITSYDLEQESKDFLATKNLKNLATLMRMPIRKLKYIAEHPRYNQFYIPKPKGGKRLIQSPNRYLKKLHYTINLWLQGVYMQVRPICSYGFIMDTEDAQETQNIYTNAMQHVDSNWVLNVDIKDFFHAIKVQQIQKLFRGKPFHFTKNAAHYLALLLTYQGRLPMGASTSPILSNFVCIDLDNQLSGLAQVRGWRYTRYADDMTFSSQKEFTIDDITAIRELVTKGGFIINEKKLKLSPKREAPEVTGLVLLDKPDVSKSYLKGVREDIELFHRITSDRIIHRNIFSAKAIHQLRLSILGQLEFLRFVRGDYDKAYLKLKRKLEKGEEDVRLFSTAAFFDLFQ